MNSPQTTTASTPEAWTTSASRNAANGVTSIAMPSSIGSSIRRRSCQLTSPISAPASTPPPYASTSSQVTCQPVRCSSPTVTPDGQPVDDQGGAVVDQALGAEHGHRAARQVAGQDADRRRVGGRQRGAEDPRRPPREAEPVRGGGDRGGGGDDQRGAGQDDDPQVVADLPQRGGQALPVEQGGQEHAGAPPPAAAGPAAGAARTRSAPRPARAGWPARSGSGARARRTRPGRPRARRPSRVRARTHLDQPARPSTTSETGRWTNSRPRAATRVDDRSVRVHAWARTSR